MFMVSWIFQVSCKVNVNPLIRDSCKVSEAQKALQETRSNHDSMNIPKIEFITYTYSLL